MKSSGCALLALVLALIVGGAYYFYSQRDQSSKNDQPLTSQDSLSGNLTPDDGGPTLVEPEKIILTDVSGGEGQGIVNRIYSGGKFIFTITAQLKTPDSGSFYSGWLIKQNGATEDVLSTGKLEQNGGDYYLEYKSDIDYTSYKKAVVSVQSKESGKPEKAILEGQFK